MSESSSPQQPDGEVNKHDSCSLCAEDGVEDDHRPTDDEVEIDAAIQVGEAVATFTVVPPDGGWGWVIVGASFFCNLVVDGIIFAFGMFLRDIAGTFGESKAKVSIIGSLLAGFYLMVGEWHTARPFCTLMQSSFRISCCAWCPYTAPFLFKLGF
jgi:hypothetical protein